MQRTEIFGHNCKKKSKQGIIQEPSLLNRKHGENITVKYKPIKQKSGLLAETSAVVTAKGLSDETNLHAHLHPLL